MYSIITIDFARTLYEGNQNKTAHAFDHVLRVTRLAERIALEERADLDVVRVASLLHDIAREEKDHHLVGAQRARELLSNAPECFIDAVVHCIEAHSFDTLPDPYTLEAKCLCDADRLDAIGAIGIARVFAVAGIYDSRLWMAPLDEVYKEIGEDLRLYREQHGKSNNYTPSHELVCKLEGLALNMFTDAARHIATERHNYMIAFFHRLDMEALGKA